MAWVTAGMYGSELIDRLVVIGLPHLGISSTNMSGSQYVKSLYMMTFQAPWLPEKTFTMGNASMMRKAFVEAPMGIRNAGVLGAACQHCHQKQQQCAIHELSRSCLPVEPLVGSLYEQRSCYNIQSLTSLPAGAFTEQDLAWYRQAFCQPGAATATFNYYRALVRWQLFADRDDPAWR